MRRCRFFAVLFAIALSGAILAAKEDRRNSHVFENIVEHGMDAVGAVNFYDNPHPELLEIAPSGRLSRNQAIFDLMALIYTINEVHPAMFSECSQSDLMGALNRTVSSLPDSLTVAELYRHAAPIVAMIGDGHTALKIPKEDILTKETKRLPILGYINNRRELICQASLDSIIPVGANILRINGIDIDTMIDSMFTYISGEREHFKWASVSDDFHALHELLFKADRYEIEYEPWDSVTASVVTLPAVELSKIPEKQRRKRKPDYAYVADSVNNVAVMEFNRFNNPDRMTQFADSMFSELRRKRITNLIIDVRDNVGGNSDVGDVLLRYISKEPFTQFDKMLVKITPETIKLMGDRGNMVPGLFFIETDADHLIKPRNEEEGHYNGNVYLLTSNQTYSSASSFAWLFKVCGMGTVIGEETGGMSVAYGDVLTYTLPISKLSSIISYKRFWHYKADENDIHGAMPDVNVPADKAMTTALRLAERKKRR